MILKPGALKRSLHTIKFGHHGSCHRFLELKRSHLKIQVTSSMSSHARSNPNLSKNAKLQPQDEDIKTIRNIGIVAHIDAGKTTTTERFLYYSGFVDRMGEVHEGDTVTDYMPQERERGITITSAAITLPWKKYKINLIDTPGHVDFTCEVERSLCVLDGAVTILDGSAGVEAQTLTVWRQADRYRIPRIIYLNKMDKPAASVESCLISIERKLHTKPLLTQLPVPEEGKKFRGIVDVISRDMYMWPPPDKDSDGREFEIKQLTSELDSYLYERTEEVREKIINTLSDHDDSFGEVVINCDHVKDVPSSAIMNALRRTTILQKPIVPVLIGSSYRNVGVQPLLDAIIKFFPSPLESSSHTHLLKHYGDNNLCALAFKIIHHPQHGQLTFLRIYSGTLKPNATYYNINRDSHAKVVKVLMAFADTFEEMRQISKGNIAIVTGLENTISGDTLVQSKEVATEVAKKYAADNKIKDQELVPVLAGIEFPEPVFFCNIESPSLSKQKTLDLALANLQKEDPSLKVKQDESGQTILSGMGELHIEIIKDRLLKEYGLDAFFGPLQVSYRETLAQGQSGEASVQVNKTMGGAKHMINMTLRVRSSDEFGFTSHEAIDEKQYRPKKKSIRVVTTHENNLHRIWGVHLKAIENGVSMGFNHGPIANFPIIGVDVDLLWFEAGRSTSLAMIAAAASECVFKAMRNASPLLLEPIMKLEITTSENYVGRILSDLSLRRSHIKGVESRGDTRIINSLTPLSQLIKYSSFLRTMTSGNAHFSMEFHSYQAMGDQDAKKAIAQITGLGT